MGANDERMTQRTDPAFELLPNGKTLLQERLAIYSLSLLVIASGYWAGFPLIWSAHPGVTGQAAKHLHAAPEPLAGRGVPTDLEAIVLSCLAKQPNARPSSARALREALERCAKVNAWTSRDAESWWIGHAAALENRRAERKHRGSSQGKTVIVDLREQRSEVMAAERD